MSNIVMSLEQVRTIKVFGLNTDVMKSVFGWIEHENAEPEFSIFDVGMMPALTLSELFDIYRSKGLTIDIGKQFITVDFNGKWNMSEPVSADLMECFYKLTVKLLKAKRL